jgi:hypothetical protein
MIGAAPAAEQVLDVGEVGGVQADQQVVVGQSRRGQLPRAMPAGVVPASG